MNVLKKVKLRLHEKVLNKMGQKSSNKKTLSPKTSAKTKVKVKVKIKVKSSKALPKVSTKKITAIQLKNKLVSKSNSNVKSKIKTTFQKLKQKEKPIQPMTQRKQEALEGMEIHAVDPKVDMELDKALIEATRKGDPRAFNDLVEKYQHRVNRIVSRYIKDHAEVLDVTQEVFIKAYRALDRFRGDSAFYTWLYRIAINTCKNYLVAQLRKVRGIDIDMPDLENFLVNNVPKETATPERILMRDEIEHVVFDVIDHLPKDLKVAITLREMEGMSYEQIASIMGCPVGTVRSRIYRARMAIERSVTPLLM